MSFPLYRRNNNTGWSKSLRAPVHNLHTIDDLKMAITEYIRNVDRAILTRSSRTQFGVSINVWRLAGDTWTLLVTFCIVIIRYTETFWSSYSINNNNDVFALMLYRPRCSCVMLSMLYGTAGFDVLTSNISFIRVPKTEKCDVTASNGTLQSASSRRVHMT
jgi:hypothetical protein